MPVRRVRVWFALSAAYLLLYVGVALFYLLDPDLSGEDKALTTIGVAAFPALAFVASAWPLLRRSRSRVALGLGAAFAWVAAFFQLMLTFGFALPLSLVLMTVALVDIERAARLRR